MRDLLRYEPGISVPSDNRGGGQGINIRGVDANRVDLRVDGIRLPDSFSFGVTRLGRDYVDLETLNALTIFRGTSAGETDSAALGGTVLFETATAKNLLDRIGKDFYTNLRGLYSGSDNTFSGTFTQANRFGAGDLLFIYTRRDGGDFRIKDERFRDNAVRERNNFLVKFGYQLNSKSRLDWTGESFVDEVDSRFSTANLPGMVFEGSTQNLFEERRTDRKRISLGYSFDNSKDPGWLQSAKVQIYYQDVEVNEESDRTVLTRGRITQDQAEKEFIERSIGGSLKFRSNFKLGTLDSKLIYGLEASNSYNERNDDRFDIIRGTRIPQIGYPRKDYPDSNTLRVSIFAQNELSFNQGKVKLMPGLRFDSYRLSVEANPEYLQKREQPVEFADTNFSPSLGLIYQPNANVMLFGRYSRGFRPPLYSELNTSFRADIPVRPHKGIPNPDLTSETANNFELGIKTRSKQFDFDVTGFYNRYQDFIEANRFVGFDFNDISFGVPFQIIQSTNIPKVEIYGLEVKGAYRFSPNPGGLYLRGAFGWQYGNDLSNDQPLSTVEPLKLVVGLGYQDRADRWGVELTTTFVAKAREQANFISIASQTFSNASPVLVNPYEPPAYTLVDVRGYYNITPQLGITLGLYNLFDIEYYQYSDVRSIDTNSRVFEAQRGRSGQAGRNLSVGLNWQF
ncbi:TonB-dependent hemoglobin/transferrin/lactoferrin family receptor [Alkalinema pantanalense CENA528]|uniref:TonB-dependent hemoglobin/transferrin/lactoferrin family receptor n=1 Tax=Alkalinema pantanalense TaxID=1620705 RepID=UPI003D70024C